MLLIQLWHEFNFWLQKSEKGLEYKPDTIITPPNFTVLSTSLILNFTEMTTEAMGLPGGDWGVQALTQMELIS